MKNKTNKNQKKRINRTEQNKQIKKNATNKKHTNKNQPKQKKNQNKQLNLKQKVDKTEFWVYKLYYTEWNKYSEQGYF